LAESTYVWASILELGSFLGVIKMIKLDLYLTSFSQSYDCREPRGRLEKVDEILAIISFSLTSWQTGRGKNDTPEEWIDEIY
jgi:hypothetical protein